jgi:hypothetical protein
MLGELGGGALEGMITGLGDYSVKKNVFMSGNLPTIMNVPDGGGIVHRYQEYIGDVFSSATANTFSIQSFTINPSNGQLFPFLAQVAANYEQYELEGVIFQFKSMSGDALNSVNTALGSVMMATQYDVLDNPFVSKREMLNYQYSTDCKPSQSTLHMIECDPHQTGISLLYTLSDGATIPVSGDPRLYNLGRFSIASTGCQGTNVNLGELHVTYQVRLLKPKLYSSLGYINKWYRQILSYTAGNAYTNANPVGTAAALALPNGVAAGTSFRTSAGNMDIVFSPTTIAFPASQRSQIYYYRMEIAWTGNTSVSLLPPTITVTGGSLVASEGNGASTAAYFGYDLGIISDGVNPLLLTFATNGVLPTNGGNILSQLVIRILQVSPDEGAQ